MTQLQSLLHDAGFYWGTFSGKADASTIAAVRAWQRSLGVADDGVVGRGDVIFVPHLPARLALDPASISVGASVAGGEAAVRVLGAPRLAIPMTNAQAEMMPGHAVVRLTSPSGRVWKARTGRQVLDRRQGTTTVTLTSFSGSAICGSSCGEIGVGGKTLIPARIVIVPTTSGLTVPTAAITTDAGGGAGVIDSAGKFRAVTVVASSAGTSVVSGVAEGLRVRVPADLQARS
ncbi:MAG: peptidoglycan-binding domain-containing protein [Nocardioidaceae bacterium]